MKLKKMGRESEGMENNKKHYVLVHGACHGVWCWYKVKPRLEAAGHRVTVVDLAASGVNGRKLEELTSMCDYSEPLLELMANLGSEERVVLVGHSLGGLSLAVAMDKFPNKVALAVFLTAFMPDTLNNPSYVLHQFIESMPKEVWLDTEFSPCGSITSMLFGPNFLASKLYQLSSTEDLELAKTSIRPSSLFVEDLSKSNNFSEQGYGSVPRGYIVCKQDMGIPLEFQKWMIQNDGRIREVLEIEDADHMPMFSTPHQLCDALLQIASNYH